MHSTDKLTKPLSFAAAARRLVTMQPMGLCGLAGPGRGNFSDGPLIGETVNVIEGENLFQTLQLNLLSRSPIPAIGADIAAWEEGAPAGAEPYRGVVDYLTRPTRWVHLVPTQEGVVSAEMLPCVGIPAGADLVQDPMLAYDGSDEKRGPRPVRLQSGRAAWRYADSFLSLGVNRIRPCAAVTHLKELLTEGVLEPKSKATLRLLGSERRPGKAVLVKWRDETLPFRFSLLGDGGLGAEVSEAIFDADHASKTLWGATRSLATRYLKLVSGSSEPNALNALVEECDQRALFWGELDSTGPKLLLDPEGAAAVWKVRVAASLAKSYEQTRMSLPSRGAAYEAYASAAGIVYSRVRDLRKRAGAFEGQVRGEEFAAIS
jgi:hypothetical protein